MLFLGKRLLHAGLILLGVTLICYLQHKQQQIAEIGRAHV